VSVNFAIYEARCRFTNVKKSSVVFSIDIWVHMPPALHVVNYSKLYIVRCFSFVICSMFVRTISSQSIR